MIESVISDRPEISDKVDRTERKPIRLLIVDDHPLARMGTRRFVEKRENLIVVGEAADGEEALSKASELSPDVVLMDVELPKLDGLAATKRLHENNPEARVLVLSAHLGNEMASRAARAGACGFVSKEASAAELLQAIEAAAEGRKYFSESSQLSSMAQRQAAELSRREREVLLAVVDGLTNEEIGERLGLSVRTVHGHRENIHRKLKVQGVANLTRFAIQAGLISM
jgi:two-component system nitrate/nitrite response regulator NarL